MSTKRDRVLRPLLVCYSPGSLVRLRPLTPSIAATNPDNVMYYQNGI